MSQLYVHLDWAVSPVRLVVAAMTFFTLAFATVPGRADFTPAYMDNFEKICHQPLILINFLRSLPLSEDLDTASMRIPEALRKIGFEVVAKPTSKIMRIGAKMVPVEGHVFWAHFEVSDQRPWIDIVEFENQDACKAVFDQRYQGHSGTPRSEYFSFYTYKAEKGWDAVSTIIKRDRTLFNFGFAIHFNIESADEPEKLKYVSTSIDSLTWVMEAVARALIDPEVITWIPPAVPDENEVRRLRLAGFARLWSEIKYNFVFFERLPNLDWDAVLELYFPRIEAAQSQEEYIRILQECVALLRDGHTRIGGGRSGDTPLLNIEPIGGKPVVTTVGDTPEMQASGIRPGMELVRVNGVSVNQVLEREIYPYVFASTPQGRDVNAFKRLLEAESDSTISATFLDRKGKMYTVDLVCDLSKHRDAAPWTKPPSGFEYQQLPGKIAYVAINTFGSEKIVKEFDDTFDKILDSQGLIMDVRNNGGGSTGNGYAMIARLIDEPCEQTSKWRTRDYNPTFRAWGRSEEWYEGDHGVIEPRGDRSFRGPVVVLIGPKTYSAAEDFLVPLKASGRATLVGEPTGGSTGQPLRIEVYGASLGICTKWDRFPDGTEFVGYGVSPHVAIEPTVEDILNHRDMVLEKGIEVLKQKIGSAGKQKE